MENLNILYLDSFSRSKDDSEASDEIGYGPTSNLAIKKQLIELGYAVTDLQSLGVNADSKLEWINASYNVLRTISLENYNVVFIFHSFHQFPSEVKRILLDRGFPNIKIIGYTHGSHWDITDTFRENFYPGMKVTDLANLLALDGILVVSEYFKKVLLDSFFKFNPEISQELERKMFVTGLPINNLLIDRYKTNKGDNQIQIIFNHSPTIGKNPSAFFRVIDEIISNYDTKLIITRRFNENSPGYNDLQSLHNRYPEKVILGNTMNQADYYTALWQSHIQVSTAIHESLGISTLEAMYTYNCCLLPNRQSYPEITSNTNLYNTESELLKLLIYYVSNTDAQQKASLYMHKMSLNFMPEVVVERISKALRSVLS